MQKLNSQKFHNPFDLKHKIERTLWNVVYYALFRFSPTPLFFWRNTLLRLFGAKICEGVHIYPSAKIWFPRNLSMGAHACLAPHVICYCVDVIQIEDYAIVSQHAHLCTATHDIDSPDFLLITRPIHIQSNAWVAADAFVGPGVTLHEGSVVGARCVVMKDVASGDVVAGNPAHIIRKRQNFVYCPAPNSSANEEQIQK